MLDDVRIDFERQIANLQREILGASYCPVCSAICSFHFDKSLIINASSERLHDVMSDDVNL